MSERGRRQARAIGPLVVDLVPAVAVVSDLARTRQAADLIGLDGATPSAAWREADLGEWTGRSKADLLATCPDLYRRRRDGRYDPPGADGWETFKARVAGTLAALPDTPGPTVVVTHGGVIRAACALLVCLDPDRMVPVDPGSATAFDLADTARLEAFNVTGSASSMAASFGSFGRNWSATSSDRADRWRASPGAAWNGDKPEPISRPPYAKIGLSN